MPIYSFGCLAKICNFPKLWMIGRKSEAEVEELGSGPDREPLVGLCRQSLTSNPG